MVKKYFLWSNTFKRRQLYVLMCTDLITMPEVFEADFKSDLLALTLDRVITVRLAVARFLKQYYLANLDKAFSVDAALAGAIS